jgi:hypothetical protein
VQLRGHHQQQQVEVPEQQQQQEEEEQECAQYDVLSEWQQQLNGTTSFQECAAFLVIMYRDLAAVLDCEISQMMLDLGLALAAQLPSSLCCCNPACISPLKQSEV